MQQLRCNLFALSVSISTILAGGTAFADVPKLIHYQGKLVTTTGAIVAGPVAIRARLYDSPTASTPILFDESHAGVQLNRGLFSVLLGSQTGGGVPDSALAGSNVYLGIAVDGAAELAPRIRIATAPFAGKSRSAEQLVRPGSVQPAVTVDSSGKVGIGTTTPDATALLDLSSGSLGFTLPRLTTAQRDAISSPALGLQIFNVDTNCINMWIPSTWKQACFDCTFAPPVAGNNGPVCEGSTLALTATTIVGATYQWTGPNGFSSSNQNPSITNATPSASGPYSVIATKDGCTTSSVTTLATVNPIPSSPTAGSNSPLCAGQTLMLTATSIAGAIHNWTGPDGFTSNLQNPTISNVTTAASGTYTVVASVNGCAASQSSTSVTVSAIPAMPGSINGPATVCNGQTGVTYSISDVPGATSYAWTVPAGASVVSGQGTAFATVNFGSNAGDISVTASNSCGTSAARTLSLSMINVPAMPGTITGSSNVYPNQTGASYSISAVSGATTYTWTVPSGSTVASGQGTTTVTVNFGTTPGEICVTAGNTCGTSAARCLTLNMVLASCLAIKTASPASTDGIYTIDPDGAGGSSSLSVYCEMDNAGGGWTLAMVQNVGNNWGCLNPSMSPPTSPNSVSNDALHYNAFSAMNAQEMYVWETGNSRVLKFYYPRPGVTFVNNYRNFTERSCAGLGHYAGDGPHTGGDRVNSGQCNAGHVNQACATGNYAGFLARNDCRTDDTNSHPSWGNCPGNGTTYTSGSDCWFYGGGDMSNVSSLTNCPGGSRASWASYNTGGMSGQINLYVR